MSHQLTSLVTPLTSSTPNPHPPKPSTAKISSRVRFRGALRKALSPKKEPPGTFYYSFAGSEYPTTAGTYPDHFHLTEKEFSILKKAYHCVGGIRYDDARGMCHFLTSLGVQTMVEEKAIQSLMQELRHEEKNLTKKYSDSARMSVPIFFTLMHRLKKIFSETVGATDRDMRDAFIATGGNSDRTGVIAGDAFARLCREVNLSIDVQALIDEMDEDGDGYVSYDEFSKMLNHSVEGVDADPRALFMKLGGDVDDPRSTIYVGKIVENVHQFHHEYDIQQMVLEVVSNIQEEHLTFNCFVDKVIMPFDNLLSGGPPEVPEVNFVKRENRSASIGSSTLFASVKNPFMGSYSSSLSNGHWLAVTCQDPAEHDSESITNMRLTLAHVMTNFLSTQGGPRRCELVLRSMTHIDGLHPSVLYNAVMRFGGLGPSRGLGPRLRTFRLQRARKGRALIRLRFVMALENALALLTMHQNEHLPNCLSCQKKIGFQKPKEDDIKLFGTLRLRNLRCGTINTQLRPLAESDPRPLVERLRRDSHNLTTTNTSERVWRGAGLGKYVEMFPHCPEGAYPALPPPSAVSRNAISFFAKERAKQKKGGTREMVEDDVIQAVFYKNEPCKPKTKKVTTIPCWRPLAHHDENPIAKREELSPRAQTSHVPSSFPAQKDTYAAWFLSDFSKSLKKMAMMRNPRAPPPRDHHPRSPPEEDVVSSRWSLGESDHQPPTLPPALSPSVPAPSSCKVLGSMMHRHAELRKKKWGRMFESLFHKVLRDEAEKRAKVASMERSELHILREMKVRDFFGI